jgi:hypothetical protein
LTLRVRLSPPIPPNQVLSVVAQQLHALQSALRTCAERVVFEGREMRVLPGCGVFVTMNPGYAGRTELPDNLKVSKGACLFLDKQLSLQCSS